MNTHANPVPGELGEVDETYAARPLSDVRDDVVAYNRRYVYHPHDSTHWLIALWVAHTHGLDRWGYTGRLYIHAPQPGVGKSMQAKVMQRLCPNDHKTVGVSAPGLFRAIALGRPTVFLEEADNQFSRWGGKDRDDVTAVVNGGYEPGNYVVRRSAASRCPSRPTRRYASSVSTTAPCRRRRPRGASQYR